MQANPGKFHLIFVTKEIGYDPLVLNIGDAQIKSEKCVKLLGVILDDKLNFHEHVSELCIKSARQVNAFRRYAKYLDFKTRLSIYKCFILSNFNFCNTIWMFCSGADIDKMEKIQERALRFVFSDHQSDYSTLIKHAGVCTLEISRMRTLATEVYKAYNKLGPSYTNDLFKPNSNDLGLRSINSVNLPRYKTVTYGRNSLRFTGAHIWNSLDIELRTAVSIKEFKTLIKNWDGIECKCAMCRND